MIVMWGSREQLPLLSWPLLRGVSSLLFYIFFLGSSREATSFYPGASKYFCQYRLVYVYTG
jgi:hypothetical protein